MCSSSQNKDSHGKLHSPFQVLFQRSRVLFLHECSKFISFCILAERGANTIMDTVDFEEAAALCAQCSLTSGRKKKELSESPWTERGRIRRTVCKRWWSRRSSHKQDKQLCCPEAYSIWDCSEGNCVLFYWVTNCFRTSKPPFRIKHNHRKSLHIEKNFSKAQSWLPADK